MGRWRVSFSRRRLSDEPNTTPSGTEPVKLAKKAWRHSFEGSAAIANFGRFYPHSADGVLVWQVSCCVLSHEVSSLF